MALHHATSGEIIEVRTSDNTQAESISTALVKTVHLEVIRMVLPDGKFIAEHQVAGEITIHCLEGLLELSVHGRTQQLHPNQMLYLAGAEPHALKAVMKTVLLVTILLKPN